MSSPGTSLPSLTDVFNTIKAQEANFPIPQTTGTYVIGTFDAASGRFTYAIPTYTKKEAAPAPPRFPIIKPLPPITLTGGNLSTLNVENVVLQFNVTNRQGRDFVLSVPGYAAVHAPQGQNFVTLNVAKASSIDQFTLTCGGTFISELPLQISHQIVGAGAFIMPALPVAIVYAPPVDQNHKNTASFSFSNSTATSISVLSTQQSSTGTPDPQFNVPAALATDMQTIGGDLQKIPATQAVGTALGIIGGAVALIPQIFGQTTVTTTVGTTTSNQHVVTLTFTQQQGLATDPQDGGPGVGDTILYLVNVRVCWFVNNGSVQLALLGWDYVGSHIAGYLKNQGAQSGLDPATIQSLLALDPFVGDPDVVPPSPRFKLIATLEINGHEWTYTDSYSFTQQDTTTSMQSSSTVTNTQEGWFSFLGIGPSQTAVNTVVLSFSTATQNTVGRSITDSVALFAGPTEVYGVAIYADVIFGTFAFRSVPVAGAAVLSGTVQDTTAQPVPNAEVRLVNNGKVYVTRADAQGRYAFRSSSITPGNSVISYGSVQTQVAYAGKPVANLNLKPPVLKTA